MSSVSDLASDCIAFAVMSFYVGRYLQRKPLREDVLPALGMTQTELAKRLDVSRPTVSELLLEKRALSLEIATHSMQYGSPGTPCMPRICDVSTYPTRADIG